MTKIPEPATPLPWQWGVPTNPEIKSSAIVFAAFDLPVTFAVGKNALPDMKFAVTACNTFPELVEKVADFLAAEDAVEKEAKRASETGTAWSSAPVVNRIHKLDDLRALLNRIGGEADG